MRLIYTLCFMKRSKMFLHRYYHTPRRKWLQNKVFSSCSVVNLRSENLREPVREPDFIQNNYKKYPKDLLYKNSKDILLQRILKSASLKELFRTFDDKSKDYKSRHLAQTVFVLFDLNRIYQETNYLKRPSKDFIAVLNREESYHKLLELVRKKIKHFDVTNLSYTMLYLHKLGLQLHEETLQILAKELENKLVRKFSILPASRYVETVFMEPCLRSFFLCQRLIPFLIENIDSCESNDLGALTTALNKLNLIVTDEQLDKYDKRIKRFIKEDVITAKNYQIILDIIQFLNYPKWREKNSVLISQCILLLKPHLSILNAAEIGSLFEVFFKIQEPAEILTDLQRYSSRLFHQMDNSLTLEKLYLFNSIIFFTAPSQREKFQNIVKGYVKQYSEYEMLLVLRKLLSYTKVSDLNICDIYWGKMHDFLQTDPDIDIYRLAHSYMNFNLDVDNYRNFQFEKEMLKILNNVLKQGVFNYYYQKLTTALCFVLLYASDIVLLEVLVDKFEQNCEQIRHTDCLKIAGVLRAIGGSPDRYLRKKYINRITRVLDDFIGQEACKRTNIWENNVLLKAYITKSSFNMSVVNHLLGNFEDSRYISSKNIDNITYCLLQTNSLQPEIIDNIVKYIVEYQDHILGFNVSRIVYLCYILGYTPSNADTFFEVASNVIIRDQERFFGLSLIQYALGLCFFNKLTPSLIKTIFNVEFMDRLDNELRNCYSKESYPQKVRHHLMQLNRAVCLEYPEFNVPWFHQNYCEEVLKVTKQKQFFATNKIGADLLKILGQEESLHKNAISPYGYHIDFTIYFDSNNKIVAQEELASRKLALLLIPDYSYTKIVNQMKGNYQLKKRHLEILNYKVSEIDLNQWLSLFHSKDRIRFLEKLLFSSENR